jgi:signal transduction histidine kinase
MDLLCLSFVVYVSGGLEAPIFMFYVFHMIIGSLILPAFVMYSIAGTLIVVFSLLSILELYGVIPHYTISGLLPFNFYDNLIYVIGVLSIFSSVVIITVMLTSKISSELYGREKHLKKALDELNEAEKSKQKYVIAIVHELKSPIVASMSQMELVLGNFVGEINENVRAKIQIAKERALGAIEMINNILHVSKFKLFNNLKMEEVLLTPIILSRINVLANIAERNRISVKFENAENENVKINADNVLLELVFSNLIGNAVKYTQENGNVIITMKDEGNFRVVEIIDNGIGIPQTNSINILMIIIGL